MHQTGRASGPFPLEGIMVTPRQALLLSVLVAVVTIVAMVTKVIGCGLPARLFGYSWHDATVIGFGMAPRGEVAMIVALIGLNAGVIAQDIFVTVIMMSLITTVITPIVFQNWLLRPPSADEADAARSCSPVQVNSVVPVIEDAARLEPVDYPIRFRSLPGAHRCGRAITRGGRIE